MRTISVGKVFVTRMSIPRGARPRWKMMFRGWTAEIDHPYRTGTPVIFRPLFGLAVGVWGPHLDEETALASAINMRVVRSAGRVDEEEDLWG